MCREKVAIMYDARCRTWTDSVMMGSEMMAELNRNFAAAEKRAVIEEAWN